MSLLDKEQQFSNQLKLCYLRKIYINNNNKKNKTKLQDPNIFWPFKFQQK